MTSKVKYKYAYVIMQDICNKFIEVNVFVGCVVSQPDRLFTVVKWVLIIWLFGKKNNASKKIWEFVVPEIFWILVNEPSKLAQKNAILC